MDDENEILHNDNAENYPANNIQLRDGREDVTSSSDESDSNQSSISDDIDSDGDDSESRDKSDHSNGEEIEDESILSLFPGFPISVGESILAILVFALRHKITGSCLADLLKLLSMHIPQPNSCLRTLYRFRKYFDSIRSPLVRHFYCSTCFSKLRSANSRCTECADSPGTSYFIEIPLLFQLQPLFKRPGFYASLNYRFIRRKQIVENLEDIYDGDVYKSLSDRGFLADRSNISLSWNTDGISIFKSSKFNIWPFYFVVNDLPYNQRTSRENLILAGVWFGSKKPKPNLFMEMFREPLRQLYRGVDFEVPNIENPVRVRGILMCGTCDLPAKALFLNMKQYNGTFGCQKCKIKSVRVQNVTLYPYQAHLEPRDTNESIADGRRALVNQKAVKGIKGPTVLSQICHDFIVTTAIDVMHCVYLGVAKLLMALWFSSEHSGSESSLYRFLDIVDKRIASLCPPSIIQRNPRKISDMAYWKASEFKVWLLYYSIPLLQDIMSTRYMNHHKLFIFAISILNQTSISMDMLENASRDIHEYVSNFESLYGRRNLTCNLHLLLHLPDVVRNFGPLWVTSCFHFEVANGVLKTLTHGTRYSQLQISSTVSIFLNLYQLKSKCLVPNSEPWLFCETLGKASKRRRKLFPIAERTFVNGKLKRLLRPAAAILNSLTRSGMVIRSEIHTFMKLLKDGILYNSISYTRLKKYNSSFVLYEFNNENRIGIIYEFIKLSDCGCTNICGDCHENSEFVVILITCNAVNTFRSSIANSTISSIFLCNRLDDEAMVAVPVGQLKTVCFHSVVNDVLNVMVPVNTIEFE